MRTAVAKRPRRPGAKRRAQVTLPQGDTGPDTPAQTERAEIVPLYERGGDWHRKRRNHRLDILARTTWRGRETWITPRERDAGIELYDRWEATQLSGEPAWYRPVVHGGHHGSDPNPARLERVAAYRHLISAVPRHCWPIVHHVAIEQGTIRPGWTRDKASADRVREALKEGLGALAAALRM